MVAMRQHCYSNNRTVTSVEQLVIVARPRADPCTAETVAATSHD
jgi:hypothetical protein